MVAKHSSPGLVATTHVETTASLDELVECCGWPLVLGANARRLRCELSQHNPECVLFWLHDWLGVTATARLIAWARQRGPRPYRVAIAHQLEGDVEAVLRIAGAHGYLLLTGRPSEFVSGALRPLLHDISRSAAPTVARPYHLIVTDGRSAATDTQHDLIRPP